MYLGDAMTPSRTLLGLGLQSVGIWPRQQVHTHGEQGPGPVKHQGAIPRWRLPWEHASDQEG